MGIEAKLAIATPTVIMLIMVVQLLIVKFRNDKQH